MWIAKKQQQVKRDGGYVTVFPGDPIPEASTWPNTKTWVDGGFIRWADREEAPPPKKVVKASVSPAPKKVDEPSEPKKRKRKGTNEAVAAAIAVAASTFKKAPESEESEKE